MISLNSSQFNVSGEKKSKRSKYVHIKLKNNLDISIVSQNYKKMEGLTRTPAELLRIYDPIRVLPVAYPGSDDEYTHFRDHE